MKPLSPLILALALSVSSCGGDSPTVSRPDLPDDPNHRVDQPDDDDDPTTDNPDAPDPELDDTSMRFSSPKLKLAYSSPGTLFAIDATRKIVSVRSLTTGDAVTVTFSSPIDAVEAKDTASIDINGESSETTITAVNRDGQSIVVRTGTPSTAIYLAITDL